MTEHLHHKLAVLHQNLLHGKLPRSVRWTDAIELVEHLGQVDAQGGEEFAFTIGAERELFRRPHNSELGMDEVSRLRRFLHAAGREPAESPRPAHHPTTVIVIDHHSARVFQDLDGGGAQAEITIEPYDPHHFHRHLIHRKEAHYEGDRVPEDPSFYKQIVEALVPAQDIVLIGHGVGKSSAVELLLDHLKRNHSDIAARVKVTEIGDLSALTEPQIDALVGRVLSRDGRAHEDARLPVA
jgi:hypothetical protein